MDAEKWNEECKLALSIYSTVNPLDEGLKGVEQILDICDSAGEGLRPVLMRLKRRQKFSKKKLLEQLHEVTHEGHVSFSLSRLEPAEIYFLFAFTQNDSESRFSLDIYLSPFSVLREEGKQQEWAEWLVGLVRAFAERMPLAYAYAHEHTDTLHGVDFNAPGPLVPERVEDMYWLNVYGARQVERWGRERVLSTPAHRVEALPHGAVLVLTRPTVVDFHSEEARQAQAAALVHLRPELQKETVLSTLRQRSEVYIPVERKFDPVVADLLELTVIQSAGLFGRRREILRWNEYHPPPVSEWIPASQVPEPDVENLQQMLELYQVQWIKHLYSSFLKKAPEGVRQRSPLALAHVDAFAYNENWASYKSPILREPILEGMGAFLGMMLKMYLKGRWVPRKNLDEAAVVVGDRAWLPFLRARRHLERRQNALDYSLIQLSREALRYSTTRYTPQATASRPAPRDS